MVEVPLDYIALSHHKYFMSLREKIEKNFKKLRDLKEGAFIVKHRFVKYAISFYNDDGYFTYVVYDDKGRWVEMS